jgi:hypothetical protein
MTRDDCARIVNLIVSTWPGGVKGHVWTDVLMPLDAALAQTAYMRNRDSNRTMTVADFRASYHLALTEWQTNRTPPEPEPTTRRGPLMHRNDYLAALAQRASAGDHTAEHELGTWERIERAGNARRGKVKR